MRKLSALIALIGVVFLALGSVPAAATGDNNPHKVWVCKYVGKPGDFETFKAGKQPIQVDVSSADDYVGADFADGQNHSVVIDLVTPANTDEHNDYIGDATCPTPVPTTTVPTTSSTTEASTSTTSVTEPTTTSSTTVPVTETTLPTTTVPDTTTSTPSTEPTTSVPPTTVVPTSTTSQPPTTIQTSTSGPPTSTVPRSLPTSTGTATSSPTTSVAPPVSRSLPFTGGHGSLVVFGLLLLALGTVGAAAGGRRRSA